MLRALADLGVDDVKFDPELSRQLDEDGFVFLPGIMSRKLLETFRARLDELLAEEGDRAGTEVGQEEGCDRVSDLVNKGEIFDICYTHPLLLRAVRQVLGNDFKLSSVSSRAVLPGGGHQGLHADWLPGTRDPAGPVLPGRYQVCNSQWFLDDFTMENGPTRVVPGSHRWGRTAAEVMRDPAERRPDEKLVLAEAGSVMVFNAHLWHSGTLNRTDRPRRVMHAYFTRRANTQQLDQAAYIRQETLERISPAARVILDV
ncbi:phytanoyl-CoA dioxygenase family protein [Streptomyces sp. NPDC028722]|uniref:phytanoyl-CoA dioxygenase family protein n=1 Tax=Streptomyces sp. NPDC028722 TaxID=3155016 RepID=UPI00340BD784